MGRGSALIVTLIAVAVAVVSVVVFSQRAEPQREASIATSRALAAASIKPLRTRPDVSLALAFEAYRERALPEARVAVVRALLAARRSGRRGVLSTDSAVFGVAFSPDNKALAGAGQDGTVWLWNPATRKPIGRLTGHRGPVNAVAFSPDSKTLASGGDDGTLRLWNVATRKPIARLADNGFWVLTVAFSPDNKTLAGAGDGVLLWNAATRKPTGRLHDREGDRDCDLRGCYYGVHAVAYSPDNKTLASAGGNGTVRLWNAATRKPIGRLTGHRAQIYAVAFSPDNQTLASASDDNTVRLWNAASRKPIGRLTGHDGDVNAVAFSPDNKTVASAGDDHTVRLWENVLWRNVTELRTTICNVLETGLTRSEWTRYAPGIRYQRSCP